MQTLVLAHQGGWDEILVVLLPLTIFAALLAIARRRVGQLEQSGESSPADQPSDET